MSDAVNTNKHAVSSLYLPSPPPSLSLSLSLSLLVAQGARTTTGQSHRLIRAALEARRADALGRAPFDAPRPVQKVPNPPFKFGWPNCN